MAASNQPTFGGITVKTIVVHTIKSSLALRFVTTASVALKLSEDYLGQCGVNTTAGNKACYQWCEKAA